MEQAITQISVKGRRVNAAFLRVEGWDIMKRGRVVRIAQIRDEDYVSGETVTKPESVVESLKQAGFSADLFSFIPHFWNGEPARPDLYFEWDSVAAIPLTNYADWWAGLPQESRRNVRTAEKRGLSVQVRSYDMEFVRGIKGIYDETPVRQGRKFWHYGKPLADVYRENGTYSDQSTYIGAYIGDEMVGFIKMVNVNGCARIMQILSKNSHFDKRPANAMIAKAVEAACHNGARFLTYCKYTYGSKSDTSITEFKRRCGFKEYRFPRYYVAMTAKGAWALRLKLHRELKDVIPSRLFAFLLNARSRYYEKMLRKNSTAPTIAQTPQPK